MLKRYGILLLLLVGCATVPVQSASTPTSPLASATVISSTPTPHAILPLDDETAFIQAQHTSVARDPVLLAKQWGIIDQVVALPTPQLAQIGDSATFWLTDIETAQSRQVSATLQVQSDHFDVYSTNDVQLDTTQLQATIADFEQHGWKVLAQWYPSQFLPPRKVTILNAHIPNAGGYYTYNNEFPSNINPHSNQREMIFINADAVDFNSTDYQSTLIHEMQHVVQRNATNWPESWLNEGLSMVSEDQAGWGTDHLRNAFLAHPDLQLNRWSDQAQENLAHYGASQLWWHYLFDHVPNLSVTDVLNQRAGIDLTQFVPMIQTRYPDIRTIDELFANWAIANLLDDPTLGDGRYGYAHTATRIIPQIAPSSAISETVQQMGTDYWEWSATAQQRLITFQGNQTIPLIGAPTQSTPFWWSGRGDNRVATLTTQLTVPITEAVLTYQTWYSLESGYDFAYLSMSSDGKTWQAIQTPSSADDNQLLKYGITGDSGAWIEQNVDLAAWRGQTIYLRFWSITEDGLNFDGLALADLRLNNTPITAWDAAGFVPIRNQLEQNWQLRAILYPDNSPPLITAIPVSNGTAEWVIPANSRAVLVVTATTWQSMQAAEYTITP